ncbi:DUF6527 family protein [Nocardia alni]|uniref:DUF6527 family protein n=1 Tax=Nocardia alni TaxID=2815723 RepID=UPI0034D572E9
MVDAADEIPERLPLNGAVVVGTIDHPTWIAFDCPCVDHHRVMLNLDVRRYPAWVMQPIKMLTLQPSIDELRQGKRCHYFICKGKVQWVQYNSDDGVR